MITSTNLTESLKKAEKERAELERKTHQVRAAYFDLLAGLPKALGFSDIDEFLTAFHAYRGKAGAEPRSAKASTAAAKKQKKGAKTESIEERKAKVKAMHAAKKTNAEIAEALGVSSATVQNDKEALGLVKPRGKKTDRAKKA